MIKKYWFVNQRYLTTVGTEDNNGGMLATFCPINWDDWDGVPKKLGAEGKTEDDCAGNPTDGRRAVKIL